MTKGRGGRPVPPRRGPRRLDRHPVVGGAPRRLLHLRDEGLKARGWLLAVMGAVEAVGRPEFTLAEVYAQEGRLAALYPGNNNVRPKIRQQLQVLRDRGWLAFDGRGRYRRVF